MVLWAMNQQSQRIDRTGCGLRMTKSPCGTTAWKIAARIGLLHTGYTALTQCATTFSRQISPIILVGRSLTVG